ncbi:MAG: ATP-binding cassette domain-containing protein [Gemmatimonadales bacterium]|nr:ATP-binding cassette domain-containing protein [Gemmatimonadales bacterium]NIN11774.1 ATP-binding cassette domain-containing protein [Gemmatimonadales bacterium]NIN50330.1 ATP-binding cassette domain-containing protein [Gemmatimonadales bacterium]NIP07794.1 ATP-binding cassette domain-containing protein [Gemmatimonadales bacterium]NIQ99226.1 ATP-binding cassette domain-containing protein [Gemmatimonadales bacterium]
MGTNTPVIEARDLTKYYGDTVGVEGLDFTVEPGEVFGFLGPNGAGKTTTIRLLLDLIRPTRGEARLLGRSTQDPAVRCSVGYLPGELSLDERLTGRRMLEYLDALRPRGTPPADPRRRAEVCERLQLTAADLERVIRDDSRGTKQKIGLASALQHDPDLLILDEPTTGLDPLVREAVFELLTEAGRAGRTVFHSSHVLSEVDRTCTRVGILREGRLVAVERIDDMRKTLVRKMVVQFDGPVPVAELDLPGVEVTLEGAGHAELRVAGELDPLLRVLARHAIRNLAFPEPNLEDAFVRYYRTDAGGRE